MSPAPVIEYILLVLAAVSGLTLFLCYSSPAKDDFARVFKVAVTILFIHAIHAFVCQLLFSHRAYVDALGPFGLSYAPLLYFLFNISKGNRISLVQVLVHMAPFYGWLVFYVYILLFPVILDSGNKQIIVRIFYSGLGILFISYSLVVLFSHRLTKEKEIEITKRLIYDTLFWLLLGGVLMMVSVWTGYKTTGTRNVLFIRIFIYLLMLSAAVRAFMYQVSQLRQRTDRLSTADIGGATERAVFSRSSRYLKSSISDEQLDIYMQRLTEAT